MPTYVYECTACNTTFEVEQRITEDALKDCECGSKGTVNRIIQPTAIMFKGSGFYVNDSSGSSTSTKSSDTEACTGNPASCACSTPDPE